MFGNSDKRITGTLYNRPAEEDPNPIYEFTDEIGLSTLFGENVDTKTAINKVMDNRQFGIDDINTVGATVTEDKVLMYTGSGLMKRYEIFDFDSYMRAEQKPKKLLKEVKPVKKIPFYHHRRRF